MYITPYITLLLHRKSTVSYRIVLHLSNDKIVIAGERPAMNVKASYCA